MPLTAAEVAAGRSSVLADNIVRLGLGLGLGLGLRVTHPNSHPNPHPDPEPHPLPDGRHGGAWSWERAASVAWRPLPPPPGAGPWFFRAGGVFEAAGGNGTNGTWGVVPSEWRKDSLHVHVHGATYLLMFLSEKWAFVADRCADEAISYGRLAQGPVPEQRLVW